MGWWVGKVGVQCGPRSGLAPTCPWQRCPRAKAVACSALELRLLELPQHSNQLCVACLCLFWLCRGCLVLIGTQKHETTNPRTCFPTNVFFSSTPCAYIEFVMGVLHPCFPYIQHRRRDSLRRAGPVVENSNLIPALHWHSVFYR